MTEMKANVACKHKLPCWWCKLMNKMCIKDLLEGDGIIIMPEITKSKMKKWEKLWRGGK